MVTGSAIAASVQRPELLSRTFHTLGSGFRSGTASGHYLFAFSGAVARGGILIDDDRSAKQTSVSLPDCVADAFGGPFLVFGCASTVELFSVFTGAWTPLLPGEGLLYGSACAPDPASGCYAPDAVGSDWVRFALGCYHCGGYYLFQNIKSGAVIKDPVVAGGRTVVNLNSPALTRRLCSPLRVPRAYDAYDTGPGLIEQYGNLVLSVGGDASGQPAAFLERCGSNRRELLTRYIGNKAALPIASSARAIVWQTSSQTLSGLYLPDRKRFSIKLPKALNEVETLELTSRRMYLLLGDGTLWETAAP